MQTQWSRPAVTAGSSHQPELFAFQNVKGMAFALPCRSRSSIQRSPAGLLPVFTSASSSSGRGLARRVSLFFFFLSTGGGFVWTLGLARKTHFPQEGTSAVYSGSYAPSHSPGFLSRPPAASLRPLCSFSMLTGQPLEGSHFNEDATHRLMRPADWCGRRFSVHHASFYNFSFPPGSVSINPVGEGTVETSDQLDRSHQCLHQRDETTCGCGPNDSW